MHSIGNGNGNRPIVYDGKIAGLYDLEETLGSGHFAVVKLARHVFTGEKVAVKVIDKTKLDDVSRAHLFQEVRCMKLVQHPNVVRLYEVIDTQTKLYLILELGDGGDLYDYIMKHEGGLSESLARGYFRQIVRAISYCHQLHVVHRDLKPENVVFFEKLGVVKLTDFGFSNKFCPGQKLETSCGSLAYSAPEILLGDSYDAPAVDVWSLGVILYMLVCGQPPFEKANDSETLTMIMDCKYTIPPHVSAGCKRLIGSMLIREPEKRATLEKIAQDSWLTQGAGGGGGGGEQQEIIPEYLPLISRHQVSEEDHSLIIQRMINGNIATKEEILDALDRNEYNHITATYFLLAERKLRQQRQEHLQKHRPELSLPVNSSSRSVRNPTVEISSNHLLVPANNQLCTPRTPGAETTTSGRSRKCSIVQEEDDEDEISGCTGRDELTTPLNRRGSRSEGRINIALQERVESERLKKETITSGVSGRSTDASTGLSVGSKYQMKPTNINNPKGLENICGVKIINNNPNNVKLRLGIAGHSRTQKQQNVLETRKLLEKISRMTEETNQQLSSLQLTNTRVGSSASTIRSNSVDQNFPLEPSPFSTDPEDKRSSIDITPTKVLLDSSTITIPLNSTRPNSSHNDSIPKYKTMPSPTRPSVILTGPRLLNEIFEEGTDIGSSDSATTTPKPILKTAHHCTSTNRNDETNEGGNNSKASSATLTTQRRSKLHRTQTPSCSSSDASDDDSETRKKRANKICDTVKTLQSQRRDSYDDSSDSQDQGNAPASSGNTGTSAKFLVRATDNVNNTNSGSNTTNQENKTDEHHQQQPENENTLCDEGAIQFWKTRQKIDYQKFPKQPLQQQQQQSHINYRRHRAGRRRAGETRLRESQSLNRITEVQESELPAVVLNSTVETHHSSGNKRNDEAESNSASNNLNEIKSNLKEGKYSSVIAAVKSPVAAGAQAQTVLNLHTINSTTLNKPKGFSSRIFQGFIKRNETIQPPPPAILSSASSKNSNCLSSGGDNLTILVETHSTDEINVATLGDLTRKIRATETTATKTSSTTKRLKMLGRYFQVHKKICIPLPALFQRGRLYKAQSCSSIVKEKINPILQNNIPQNTRHSALLTDKGKILRNCLGSKFLGSSDSDINKNDKIKSIPPATTFFTVLPSSPSSSLSISSTTMTTSTRSPSASSSSLIAGHVNVPLKEKLLLEKKNQHQEILCSENLDKHVIDEAEIISSGTNSNLIKNNSSQNPFINHNNNNNNNSNNINNNNNNNNQHLPKNKKASSSVHHFHPRHQINDVPLCSSKC